MSYNTLIATEIDANSPVDEALMTKIKDNFDYLKTEQDTIKTDVNSNVSLGDFEGARNDTSRTKTPNGSVLKAKEIVLIRGGNIRVTYDHITDQVGVGQYTKIYKNNSPVGSANEPTLSTTTISEDITGFAAGDTLEVHVYMPAGTKIITVSNLRLHSAEGCGLGGGNLNY